MSGYTANVIHKKGILEKEPNFISKPLAPSDLPAHGAQDTDT